MSSSNDTINTVVVYHSGYGHTKRMAEAVADGAGAVLFAIDGNGVLPEAGWGALSTPQTRSFSGHPRIWADQAGNSISSPMKL
jgi:hypothetical protein